MKADIHRRCLEHTAFCMYKNAGHRVAFVVFYVRKSQIVLNILERRTGIYGQVRMSVFSEIEASQMQSNMELHRYTNDVADL